MTCIKVFYFIEIYNEWKESYAKYGVNPMKRALLVDDEIRTLHLVEKFLEKENIYCKKAECAEEALDYMKEEAFSIALLDIRLPGMDGWSLCEEIRAFSDIPIMMVSACAEKEEVIKGLNLGADDYMTKPFHFGEMTARVKALLRRTQSKNEVTVNGLCWNEACFKLTYHTKSIKLTPKEFTILGQFMKNPNQVFAREQLISMIWEYTAVTDARTVDSHVQNIREKLRKAAFPVDAHFQTVWGVGYKWVNAV